MRFQERRTDLQMLKEKSLNLNFVFYIVTVAFIFAIFFCRFSADTEVLFKLLSSSSCAPLRRCPCPSFVCSCLSRAKKCLKMERERKYLNFAVENNC